MSEVDEITKYLFYCQNKDKIKGDISKIYWVGNEMIVVGSPEDTDDHNCDEMRCTSVCCTLFREKTGEP
jgi:hypothetical protein